MRVSTLTLVDLAGSERISKTKSEGLRMREGMAVNKSLLNLGIVINQLSNNSPSISYRDSKLTRILQPSLDGNTKTTILCNITPAMSHMDESTNTLRFGCRAKKIVTDAHVNEVISDAALLKKQAKEIEKLKKQLLDNGFTSDMTSEINKLREKLLETERERELINYRLTEEKALKEKAERHLELMTKIVKDHTKKNDHNDELQQQQQQEMTQRRVTWCPDTKEHFISKY